MRLHRLLAATAAVITLPLVVFTPAAASAAPISCTFQPVLPSRIAIGQAVVGVRVGLRYNDPSCANTQFFGSASLVHGTDSNFESWDDTDRVDVLSLYAFSIAPGRYATTAGTFSCYDSDYNSIPSRFIDAATVIKFAGAARLGTRRAGRIVVMQASALRFKDYDGYVGNGLAVVDVQRLNPAAKGKPAAWQTIKRARTNSAGVLRFNYTNPVSQRYRVIVEESPAAFAATSR